MQLTKIIYDKLTNNSFGLYQNRGKLSGSGWFISWISTQHNKDSLKRIYPNTSIIFLDSHQLSDFEKKKISDLVENTKWLISDYYKIGIFDGGRYLTDIQSEKYYFVDYLDTSNSKVDNFENCFRINGTSLLYFPLNRKFTNTRCIILKLDDFRNIQLSSILD